MLNKGTRLTVITVCYNAEKEIEKTIKSVLQQSSIEYEYIIQDGMSIDNTVNIVYEFKKDFDGKGISYTIISQKDRGIYDAMNIAARKAKGEYLLFLNAGDCLAHENVIKNYVETLKSKKADVYYGDALMISDAGIMLFKADLNLINRRMPFAHQAGFISTQRFLERQYNTNYLICADYDLILKLFESNYTFEYINTIVCQYDMNGISSTAFVRKRKEHENILVEHNLGGWKSKITHISEAYAKWIIFKIVPSRLLRNLKKMYMSRVKRYKFWSGELY